MVGHFRSMSYLNTGLYTERVKKMIKRYGIITVKIGI